MLLNADCCQALEPDQRTRHLAASPLIKPAHTAVVTAGDSRVRESDWEESDHFLAFVRHGGRVWEMDGNTPRRGPLDRGAAGSDLLEVSSSSALRPSDVTSTLANGTWSPHLVAELTRPQDAARIIREVYIPRAEGSVHFSTIALVGGAGASGVA